MPSVAWTLNRLRLMSVPEMIWRGRKAVQVRLERSGAGLMLNEYAPEERWGCSWLADEVSGIDAARYLDAADRIIAGRFDLFALRALALGFPPKWNRDPKTSTEAPLRFGKTLDYRDQELVGDIKYLWELNRHYELVTLAQAFRLSGRAEYALACRRLLESWFEQNPYPLGPNWSNSLEQAIRLTNWAAAWHLLGGHRAPLFDGADGLRFRRRWLDSVYRHSHFIASHFSMFSSANNHLFGEYMGLFVASVTWPCWSQSAQWRDASKAGLEEEALKQNSTDGVNLEQAIWYHHEVADMMLLCALCGRSNGIGFSEAYCSRLEAMLGFIAALLDDAGNLPMFGDADDAQILRLSQEPGFHVYRSLLARGALWFRRGDFKRKAKRFDDKNHWLAGAVGAAAFEALPDSDAGGDGLREFPQGGYYVLGSDFGTREEVRITADVGPLGYLSIAAHGHADALSFTLSAGGVELLIDPGTYAYHTQKKWRDYFRGTAAHNTVRIDGLDQSEPGGNFMWLRKADVACEIWESDDRRDRLAGRHDGYMRLKDPVLHRRQIDYRKCDREIAVEDTLKCESAHDVEFWWHFAENCLVSVHGEMVIARRPGVRLTMRMPGCDAVPELVHGREHPPAGWISRRFDEKQPSPSVVWKQRIARTTMRLTVISVEFD